MISHLKGRLMRKGEGSAVMEVAGIGFHLYVPLSTYYQLPEVNGKCELWTYLYLGDRRPSLYGFYTQEERELFQILLNIPRIGPKAALTVVSHFSMGDLWEAVSRRDVERIKRVPGIGTKTAERLILELKERKREMKGRRERAVVRDTILSALRNLGYKKHEIEYALAHVDEKGKGEEEVIKECLKILGGFSG